MASNKTVIGTMSNIREYDYNPGAGSDTPKPADFPLGWVHRIQLQPVSMLSKKQVPLQKGEVLFAEGFLIDCPCPFGDLLKISRITNFML